MGEPGSGEKMSLPGINKDQILIRYPSKMSKMQLDIGFCSKNARDKKSESLGKLQRVGA